MKARIRQIFSDRDHLLSAAAGLTVLFSVLIALPAFLIPLGLPPEGDAVDYRVPILRWMLRHGAYPNWDWTMVDDYPMLGELFMLPFHALHPGLARLIPLGAYLGLGIAGGLLFRRLEGSGLKPATLFAMGMAVTLCLRPLALQSNLLMVDNLASMGLLFALYFAFEGKALAAGAFAAVGLGARYTVWPMMPLVPIALFWTTRGRPFLPRARSFLLFGSVAALGCLPFMIRNFLVNNGNPVFPIGDEWTMRAVADTYGRGKDPLSLFLLPFDLFFTSNFGPKSGLFDYSVGRLSCVYLLAALVAFRGWGLWGSQPKWKLYLLAGFALTLVWFYSAQQLRFLVPALVIFSMALLIPVLRLPAWIPALLVLAGCFSTLSIQKDSILLALGKREMIFSRAVEEAKSCFARAGVDSPVAYPSRGGILGFLDEDFYFTADHPYGRESAEAAGARWVYVNLDREGYEPWPRENPCLRRKAGS